MRISRVVSFLVLTIALFAALRAHALTATPAPDTTFRSPLAAPAGSPKVRAKVGIVLLTVDDYDVKTGLFSASFYLSLTSDLPMPPMALTFANGTTDERETLADRPTFKLYRLSGKFKSAPNLREYPFDAERLDIVVDDDLHGVDQIAFDVDNDRTQLARGFRVLGWQVDGFEARATSQTWPDRFEDDDLYYSRYVFSLRATRWATSAVFKVYVPALVIAIISLLGMWVPANEMEVRSNSGAPMLAGAVLFHFTLMQDLPPTPYLTRADKLMIGVYGVLLLCMLSTWLMFCVKEENVARVFRFARIAVPIGGAVVMLLTILG